MSIHPVFMSSAFFLVICGASSVAGQTIDPADTVFPDRVSTPEDLDPMVRDENISDSEVTVEVTLREDGFYEYTYYVTSGENNKGIVSALEIDLGCNFDFPDFDMPPEKEGNRNLGIGIGDRPFTPAVVRFEEERLHGISSSRKAHWHLGLRPGEDMGGMRILSPVEPGMRRYVLDPYLETLGWDYESLSEEEREAAPWKEDFQVTGMIEAPACPEDEEGRFPGSSFGPERINQLLTYSEPLRDRLTVAESVDSIQFTIHYHERIDPETFKVQPGWAKRYFAPEPGASQTVELPLRGPINRFQFRVRPPQSDKPRDEDPYHHSFQDRDVFEVRADGHPGRGRGPGGNRGSRRND